MKKKNFYLSFFSFLFFFKRFATYGCCHPCFWYSLFKLLSFIIFRLLWDPECDTSLPEDPGKRISHVNTAKSMIH